MHKLTYLTISIIMVLSFSSAGLSFDVSARPLAQTSPTLGAAGTFSILAETTITNIPLSVIGGDVGLSPATGAGIGLTDAEVAGTIYTVDAFGPPGSVIDTGLLTQAINGMMGAFTALDQPCDTNTNAVVDLTTLSPLSPGVHCADAFLLTGNLTLVGSGVWIFKADTTLTTAVGSTVTGGDACNVWWRLGSAANIFTGSSMIGNILAGTSIDMQAGASLNGRALAQAAVTLSQNTIFGPVCAAPPTSTATPTGTLTASTATPNGPGPVTPVISGLPNTGGAPIRNEDFPWSLVVFGGFSAIALGLGVRAYRRTHPPKQ